VSDELKELTEETKGLLDHVRKADKEREAEIKRLGGETAETKQVIDRMNEDFEKLEKALDDGFAEVEAKVRAAVMNGSPTEKAEKAAQTMSRMAGREVTADEAKAHEQAFRKFLCVGKAGLTADERKNLVEDATGELIVMFDLDPELYRVMPQLNVVRGLATSRTTTSDRLRARSITELSTGWGKIEVSGSITPSSGTPAEAYCYVEDLYGLTKIGEDELMDADFTLEQWINSSFGIDVANKEESGFVSGTGHASGEPVGFLTASATGFDGQTNVDTNDFTSASAAGAVSLDEIIELEFNLKAQYAANAAYLVHRKTIPAMRILKDNEGRYMWVQGGLVGGNMERVPSTFNGYPVYQSLAMDQFPTATGTKYPVVFADFKAGYLVLDRLGMTVQRLNELYAESGLVGFKAHRRVGGGILRGEAFARLKSVHT
jgi:HK97 family phage major capsid protein